MIKLFSYSYPRTGTSLQKKTFIKLKSLNFIGSLLINIMQNYFITYKKKYFNLMKFFFKIIRNL